MADTIEIRGGTVIDGTGRAPLPEATVRVAGGRVEAIWQGAARPTALTPPATIIDARGKSILPGLIDAHCHLSYGEGRSAEEVDIYGGAEWSTARALWNARKVLHAGVTAVCDPGSTWNVAVTVRDAIVNGMFEGPRIFAAGRHIVADGGFADWFPTWLGMPRSAEGVLCPTPDRMVREVRRQVKNRVDLVKISGDSDAQERDPECGACFTDHELGLIVSEAHRLGRKVTIHARYAPTVRAAVRAGVDWVIHGSYLRREDLGLLADARIPLCPTFTYTTNIVEWGAEVGVQPSFIEVKKRELEAMVDITQRAHAAGVTLLAGSETGFALTPYGEWHTRELELLVKLIGLSPMEAIVSATRTNATALGWTDTGTLAPGSRADVLVADGDPLADIQVLGERERISAVLKAGEVVDLSWRPLPRQRMRHERSFSVSERPLHRGGRGSEGRPVE
jgi:imidazolonepropionase-like amidohydrolase